MKARFKKADGELYYVDVPHPLLPKIIIPDMGEIGTPIRERTYELIRYEDHSFEYVEKT